jgi:RHS repeat-associated protein
LAGVPSHTGWAFNVDGEGRPLTAVDQTAPTNLVTNTTYYPSTLTPTVSLGSGDSDTYTIDPNTGRMTGYEFNVGSTPKYVTGTLGWNTNGTLGTLGITDAFNSLNAQSCAYTYDDLARIASVNCGASTWQQDFSYDPFGNITKTVPAGGTGVAWQPGYNAANNNQYLSGGGISYDSDGDLLGDTINTYTWDSDGNVVSINGIGLTYDAFDRMVEQNNSGTYKEVLYSPIGKLALMARQVANSVFIPLPGGEQATYTNSTIRFRHYDWLGSARFESNMSEQEYGDVAYAPFGETYSIKNTPYLSFTGQQPDTVSGLYDFLFREYNPTQGRWISPDPAGLGAVDATNPQSWNRYGYVTNNPLAVTDMLGLAAGGCQDDLGPNRNPCTGNAPSDCNATIDGSGPVPCALWLQGDGFDTEFDIIEFAMKPTTWSNCVEDGCWGPIYGNSWLLGLIGIPSSPQNPANNGPVTCSTVLPDGSTVGSHVNAVSNQINNAANSAQPVSTPYGPAPSPSLPGPISVASQVYSGTNFRGMYGGPGANYQLLGDAGNFAYFAVSANIGVPLWTAELVAGGYSITHHPPSDWVGPFGMDPSATRTVSGYGAKCH